MGTSDAAAVFSLRGKRVFVAGHRGMVGCALIRRLASESCHLLTVDRAQLDLTRQDQVVDWFASQRPEVVIAAAAKVGGIQANDSLPVDFLYDNLMIEANLIQAAWRSGVEKLLFLGSACIYPRHAAQPITEDALLTAPLEPTNQWYAVAKIAGIKLCQAYRRQHGADFITAIPANLYGPGDNFSLSGGHVIPSLMRKLHEAARNGADSVEIWGTGKPLREFLHVDDLADALVFLLGHYSEDAPINVGAGSDQSIAEVARLLAEVTGYTGAFRFDSDKPDGMPRKLLDSSRLTAIGWTPKIALAEGLSATYDWFLAHQKEARGLS
ncbi:GDP-L-fucose synthase [Magnetospira thiophila]